MTASQPYGAHALDYFDAGWFPLPLPAGEKNPPPWGRTGRPSLGNEPDRDALESERSAHAGWNIGVRMPSGVIGLDVDAYDGKPGAQTLADLVAELGELPGTAVSTSRDDSVSGIRFFRVPAGTEFIGSEPGIEIIQPHHRYAVVWPSVHPSGGIYRWSCGSVPKVSELPELPAAWVERLRAESRDRTEAQDVSVSQAEAFVNELPEGEPCRRIRRVLDDALEDLRSGGSRHDAVLKGSMSIMNLANFGHVGGRTALAELNARFKDATAGEDREDEWKRILIGAVSKQDPVLVERSCCTPDAPDAPEFWSARPVLAHVHQFARARRAAPWAVLGAVLAHAVAAVPPTVVLPPLTGSVGSLNIFTALTGPSGAGKGAAIGVARDAVRIIEPDVFSDDDSRPDVFMTKLGTGQGITRAFMELTPVDPEKPSGPKRWTQVRDRALFTNSEIDNITAHANQTAATLMSELRSAFSGEMLGQLYAANDKNVQVPGHAYRLCLIVGVQPVKAKALFDDATGGTPQRFLWFPVRDPDRPDAPPACPEPWTWRLPDLPGDRVVIDVCEVARLEIDADFLARQDADDSDDLDAHAMFTRLKIAAAFGLLEGRLEVNEEDWELASAVMDASTRTRKGIVAALRSETAQQSAAKRKEAVQTAVEVETATEELKIEKAEKRALTVLRKRGGWFAAGKLAAEAGSAYREHLKTALDRLIDQGEVESQESDNTVKFRILEES
ncbi:bifunctional DNA primase/polymerase [Acrocarpospora pleiomorpha]|uniref:bifunctional DNA primase/polymerase n=1 Tax=Acrocarpospora pleiomorpha TaxID=90975 RepID=UPI00147909FC|nr:bifunctional DNA primase/polymerase [Acrocarpospora pleiomorpha]